LFCPLLHQKGFNDIVTAHHTLANPKYIKNDITLDPKLQFWMALEHFLDMLEKYLDFQSNDYGFVHYFIKNGSMML
jgi:hypothetical protein